MNNMAILFCIALVCLIVGWILVFIGRKQKNATMKKGLYFLSMLLFVVALLCSGYGYSLADLFVKALK